MSRRIRTTSYLMSCICLAGTALGQVKWTDPTANWTTLGPPAGTLMIHGGTFGGKGADTFLAAVGDAEALIVVIPTAGADENCGDNTPAAVDLRQRGAKHVQVLHTRERTVANSAEFVAPLRRAKGVWISGEQQSRLAKAYLHTLTHRELFAVMERGGVVSGNSAGASIQGAFLYGGHAAGDIGFGFVRQSVVGQHYIRRRRLGGVARIVAKEPELLGLGIDEDTFVVVRGDTFEVAGGGKVALCNARRAGWSSANPYEFLLAGDQYDMKERRILTPRIWDPADQWPDARQPWADPAAKWTTCGPPNGTLLLAGGQATPAIMQRFLDLAGGPDARIVVIPTAGLDGRDERNADLAALKALGAKNVELWHTIDRDAANSVKFVAPLTNARGVWFCAGDAWRLADAYLHTLAHQRLFELLNHGGVIAAEGGAARFLALQMAGDPHGWDEGTGLLKDTVVHTWPSASRRIDDLVAVLKAKPTLLGIGIDEGSAITVRGDELEVLGDAKTAAFDATRRGWPWEKDEDPYVLLGHGEHYNLKTRRPDW